MGHKEYWREVRKIFLLASPVLFVAGSVIHIILQKGFSLTSLVVGVVFASIGGGFMAFHVSRNLARETLEINSGNKDKQKGMSWYLEATEQFFLEQGYELVVVESHKKRFVPPPRAHLLGGEIIMEWDAYSMTVTGPKGSMRILASLLDIKKIFL